MRASKPRFRRLRWVAVALLCTALALLVLRAVPAQPLALRAPQSLAVYDRDGQLLRLTLAGDQRYRLWTPLLEIAPSLRQAVLLHEDAWFYSHPGVNPVSLLRGAWVTYGRGGTPVGGSTISMQLARLLGRLDTRSPAGKLRQIGHALWLELRYSKQDIFEAYLNLAPYGGNIEGVGAASLIYFGKPARDLGLPEALTLAVLPQAPARRGRLVPGTSSHEIGPALRQARDRLYARYRQQHTQDSAADALLALPLGLRAPRELPFAAPHFVERVLAERWRQGAGGSDVHTTLDLRLQKLLQRRIDAHLVGLRARGLSNAAALLVDTRDMGVRALVGSADYFNASIHGQVNASIAKRSPGSTLKPFLYALAIDQGQLHPASVLRDVPSAFGRFSPENFDGRFLGPVTATEALVRSRNIPAVSVASRLRSPDLHEFLRAAGVTRMASAEHYGLALVLGGGEVSMEELARLYALLGNDGQLQPLRMLASDPLSSGSQLISAEAAYMVRTMLRQNPRPDLATHAATSAVPAAWKTGTSWSFRDAWSAGVVGPYVLVVWMGHFDGRSNPALIGVDAAAPLFFSIVDALQAAGVDLSEPSRRWPLNLRRVEICSASGDLPNAHCPKRSHTWFIPGVSPIRLSTVHRAVQLDRVSGQVLCGPQDPARVRTEVFEFWPSDLAAVYAQAGLPRRRPPAGADCAGASSAQGSAPRLHSPLHGTTYSLRLSRPEQSSIALSASVDADVQRVHWFVGAAYLGSAASGERLQWTPTRAGQHRVRAVDDHGRASERNVGVELLP